MENSKTYDICVIGAIVVDSVFEVPCFPKEGEAIAAENHFRAAGGGGAAQSVIAAKLLGESIFAGQIGEDENGVLAEQELKNAGVNTCFLRKLKKAQTGVGYVTLTKTGQNSIINSFGANLAYEDKTTLPNEYIEAINASRVVLLQRGIPHEINTLIIKYSKSQGKIVCLDAGGRDDPFSDEILSNLDFISPNEYEVEKLVGCRCSDKIEEVLRTKLLSKYPNLKILLRLGEKGCALITQEIFIKLPSITQENDQILRDYKIIDATGAGDCWIGSFFSRYVKLEGKISQELLYTHCMRFANTCAFLCITKRGCIPSLPALETVKEFLQKYLSHKIEYPKE